MPASSTTRFSCTSPQRPRAAGWRSECTSFAVSLCSIGRSVSTKRLSCVSSEAYARSRLTSSSPSLPSTFTSCSRIGCTSCCTACSRAARSPCARSRIVSSFAAASSRKLRLLASSASADSALSSRARKPRVSATSSSFSSADLACSPARASAAASRSRVLVPSSHAAAKPAPNAVMNIRSASDMARGSPVFDGPYSSKRRWQNVTTGRSMRLDTTMSAIICCMLV